MREDFDANANDDTARVVPMGELDDYEVAEGHPDVRGWVVVAEDNRKLGTVHELIVDTQAMRTRYLDVTLDRNLEGVTDERDVLVPIGNARLDDMSDHVILDAAIVARLASLPAYSHERLTRDFERSLFPALGAAPLADKDFYAGQHFDDSRFVAGRRRDLSEADEARVFRSEEELDIAKREVRAGEVEINKVVESEHVSRRVPITREEADIERHAITGDRAAKADIHEEHIRVPLKSEEVVVDKHPVVKEEVVVKKHAVEDFTTVEADLKRERLDIERSGKTAKERKTDRDRDAR